MSDPRREFDQVFATFNAEERRTYLRLLEVYIRFCQATMPDAEKQYRRAGLLGVRLTDFEQVRN